VNFVFDCQVALLPTKILFVQICSLGIKITSLMTEKSALHKTTYQLLIEAVTAVTQ
jgi:hypothetical protein